MWGTPDPVPCVVLADRFIPTHVGNTFDVAMIKLQLSVHPHACGEHFEPILRANAKIGSSPRMWGTLTLIGGKEAIDRFIPTHVGNTASAQSRSTARTVHPHACGEHS